MRSQNPPAPSAPAPAPGGDKRRWTSETLFGKAQVILIEHQQQVYQLRQTAQGKLILTK